MLSQCFPQGLRGRACAAVLHRKHADSSRACAWPRAQGVGSLCWSVHHNVKKRCCVPRAQVESAMGPALQAAFMVVSPIGGKMLLFQSAVPSLGARPTCACQASGIITSVHIVH